LLYKTLSLILANVFLNNFGTHQSFADNTEIPTNPEVEYVEENNSNDNSSGENLYYQNNEEENNLSGDSGTENSTPEQEDPEPTNEIDPEVCSLGDIELLSPLS
jgi:hypothetical protein